jgi:hypothetical protein
MRRKQAFSGSRLFPIIVAGFVGYVVGGWSASLPQHGGALSASQAVALRFPEDAGDTATGTVPAVIPAAAKIQLASAMDEANLLSPEPMAPRAAGAPARDVAVQPAVNPEPQAAPAAQPEEAHPQPSRVAAVTPSAQTLAPPAQTMAAKALAVARKRAERPGYLLNDAQLASIKERLHMTPDQERMWPAVEAALRNLAYAKAHDARSRGAGGYQLASADTNSTQVQDLKSAAIPLLMSFNSEQKDEVRNIAHVMGLDQLATQF